MSPIHPIIAMLTLHWQVFSQHFAPLPNCVKIFPAQHYLVATVIHIQLLRSTIGVHLYILYCTYTHTHILHNIHIYGRTKQKNLTAVNAACPRNLSAWHFWHACHKSVSPALDFYRCRQYILSKRPKNIIQWRRVTFNTKWNSNID